MADEIEHDLTPVALLSGRGFCPSLGVNVGGIIMRNSISVRRGAIAACLAAISYVLMYFSFVIIPIVPFMKLDFSDMPHICEVYERCTGMTVGERSPYSGALVFAAFSGSHQDAIAKGMHWRDEKDPNRWTVPYLPIDPTDVGRNYDADVIRINSQSGKGGVGYIVLGDVAPINSFSPTPKLYDDNLIRLAILS